MKNGLISQSESAGIAVEGTHQTERHRPDKKPLEVTLFVTSDTRHLPYLFQGLTELEQSGDIHLRVLPRAPRMWDRLVVSNGRARRVARPYPWSYRMEIRKPETRRTVRVGIDLQDWDNFFSYGDLRSCQILLKRSFNPQIAEVIQARFGTVVLPAGMTFGVQFPHGNRQIPLAVAQVVGKIESFLTSPGRLAGWVRDRVVPKPAAANPMGSHPPSHPSAVPVGHDYALFQVKCHGDGDWREAEQLNQDRAALIRVLRKRLGDRFWGGMYFDGPAREEFADCLSNMPTSPKEYLQLVAKAAVVVSTNGFGGSTPWKLCEYLSLGKCIVTEDLAFPVPTPLAPNAEATFFKTHEECASVTAELLGDAPARERMGLAARNYFNRHVAPAATVRRYLETSLGHWGTGINLVTA